MRELLRLEDVHVSYGSNAVLRGVNLAVQEGEFCALLGLNGSGKTTLLHAICGFLPMRGSCVVDGQDCAALHEKKRARLLSFLSQGVGLSGGRTVLDVVLMGFNAQLGLLEFPSASHRRIAEEMLDRLGYFHLAGHDFGTLSQGQKQLVLLARCLVQDTPILLMDEPDSALDFLNRHNMLGKVRDLIHADGRGGLVSLHDPNFAMAYCDRIFLLKDGVLAGELAMKDATRELVRETLSLLYGGVDVVAHGNSFMMWKSASD